MSHATDPLSSGTPPQRPELHSKLLRQMFVHQVIFVLFIGSLNIYNYVQGAPWWALWPSMIWGVFLTIHVCIVRSITVDPEWVDQRAMNLREHSYDFDHMRDMEKRITDSDFSVVPRDERDDDNKSK